MTAGFPGSDGTAELVLVNGRCVTFVDGEDTVEAIAVRDGRIIATGPSSAVASLLGPGGRLIDLEGRVVLPGLNDTHMHAMRGGTTWNRTLQWERVRSLPEALGTVRDCAEWHAADEWIVVLGGWHASQLRERRVPTREELDAAAPEHPVYVQQLYENAILNTRALELCGWNDHSADPPNGQLIRDDQGRLTGEVRGVGAFVIALRYAVDLTVAEQADGIASMYGHLASFGLTGVIDGGGMSVRPSDYRPLFDLWRRGGLDIRTRLYVCAWTRGGEVGDVTTLVELMHPDFGDAMLKYSGLGEMPHMGFHDFEGLDTGFSIGSETAAEMATITRLCVDRGWRMSVHAVLDSSLSSVLDVWELIDRETAGGVAAARFSIVHADVASPQNLQRIRELNAGILVQNRIMLNSDSYVRAWGHATANASPPLGEMRRLGIRIGGGTDSTRANWHSPWACIWWLVTGSSIDGATTRAENDRLSRREAIAAFTRDAAWFTGEEGHRGLLASGYDADICVPSLDPFDCDARDLKDLGSDLTLLAGRVTHAAGDFRDLSPLPSHDR